MTIRSLVSRGLTIALFFGAMPLWALNTLHDARYQLIPQPPVLDRFDAYGGVVTYGQGGDFTLPFGVAMGVNDLLEIGGRLDFESRDEFRLILNIGSRLRLSKVEALQVDFRFGESWGVVAEYTLYHALNKRFSMIYTLPRVSFFEGLNGNEPVIVEVAAFPRVRVMKPIDIIADLSYSTSITSPVRYSAFDIAVGTELKLINHTRLLGLCRFGIAGAHESADFGLKIGLIYEL